MASDGNAVAGRRGERRFGPAEGCASGATTGGCSRVTMISPKAAARLSSWGITSIIGDYRGAVLEVPVRAEVTVIRRRPSFTVDCLDCGPSPHVSVDDHSAAVCLRCGRDRWL